MNTRMDGILHFSFNPDRASRIAVFLDRDGTINERIWGGYVTSGPDFKFLPGAKAALRELSCLPDRIIVISNQQCIGKGLMLVDELRAVTSRFVEEIRAEGGRIDDVYYCPHLKEQNCACRKPRPGLLKRAASDWRLDLIRCFMIGDSLSDVQAAEAAGCSGIQIGLEGVSRFRLSQSRPRAADLQEAVELILKARAAASRLAAAAAAE